MHLKWYIKQLALVNRYIVAYLVTIVLLHSALRKLTFEIENSVSIYFFEVHINVKRVIRVLILSELYELGVLVAEIIYNNILFPIEIATDIINFGYAEFLKSRIKNILTHW